jgi:hypothetical protein
MKVKSNVRAGVLATTVRGTCRSLTTTLAPKIGTCRTLYAAF